MYRYISVIHIHVLAMEHVCSNITVHTEDNINNNSSLENTILRQLQYMKSVSTDLN